LPTFTRNPDIEKARAEFERLAARFEILKPGARDRSTIERTAENPLRLLVFILRIDKASESSSRFSGELNVIISLLVAVGLIQVSVSIDSLVSPSLESPRRQISSIQETDSGPLGSTLNVILIPRLRSRDSGPDPLSRPVMTLPIKAARPGVARRSALDVADERRLFFAAFHCLPGGRVQYP